MMMVAPISDVATPLHQSRVLTLYLEGELGWGDLEKVAHELGEIALRGQNRVVLDLTDVAHLDYRGVPLLRKRAELFRQSDGDIKICGASPYLAAIFRASGAGQSFEFYANSQQAHLAFAPY